MTTATHEQASRERAAGTGRRRLISGPLALVFLSEFATLSSFYLLLSVTPMLAAAGGAGSAGAGSVTGALLLGTVAAELAVPVLLSRYGLRTVLAAGAVLLGVPALALLSGGSLAFITAVSVVRGVGFGLSTVTDALTATLLPPERRGEGLGLLGVAAEVPAVVALPLGVWLARHYGYPVVVAMAAATALVPLAAVPWLPGLVGRGKPGRAAAVRRHADPTGLLGGLRHAGQLRPALMFGASTVAAGVIVSFLPLATGVGVNIAAVGLLAQALTATVSRWWAGRHGDRHGHARLLPPALLIAALGMIGLISLSPIAVIAGMCLFGTGFGIIQNATLTLMIERMPPSGIGTASTIWNVAYDAGYGAGPAFFGLFIGRTGYPAVFALTGTLLVAAWPASRRELRSARQSRSEPA